jgi:glucosamine kinase
MTYVAGVDGGQSSTEAAVADMQGTIIGRGSAGPADELGADRSSTRLRDALTSSIGAAREAAGLGDDVEFEAVVAGISGYDGAVRGVAPSLLARRWVVVHDSVIAHAGAFGGGPGVIVIAGTGSFAYGRASDGREKRAGGWGYLFGDEGSAFWIARTALSRAMRDYDVRQARSEVIEEALRFFEATDLRTLAKRVYHGEVTRERLAAFAPAVLRIEPSMCDETGAALASLATAAFPGSGERPKVAFVGGIVANARVRQAIASRLKDACDLVEPDRSPVEGAVLLALRTAREPSK